MAREPIVVMGFEFDLLAFASMATERKAGSTISRLHYHLSTHFMILYIIDHSYAHWYWTNAIHCFETSDKKIETYESEVNEYCWKHGTYSVTNPDPIHVILLPPQFFSGCDIHRFFVVFPPHEIVPDVGGLPGSQHTTTQHNHYHEWMYFYMIVMMLLLQIPRQFWRIIKKGGMTTIARKLNEVSLSTNDDLEREAESLAEYLHRHTGHHIQYAYGFVLTTILSVAVSALLMLFWDFITGYEFSMHGVPPITILFTEFKFSSRTNRLPKVFPVLGKCTFNIYGPSGDMQPREFICALPLNMFNERAAILFWYNYMLLVAIGVIALIYRFALIVSRRMRRRQFCKLTPLTSLDDVDIILDRCSYCDWFVIHRLGSTTVGPQFFAKIMRKFAEKSRARL